MISNWFGFPMPWMDKWYFSFFHIFFGHLFLFLWKMSIHILCPFLTWIAWGLGLWNFSFSCIFCTLIWCQIIVRNIFSLYLFSSFLPLLCRSGWLSCLFSFFLSFLCFTYMLFFSRRHLWQHTSLLPLVFPSPVSFDMLFVFAYHSMNF